MKIIQYLMDGILMMELIGGFLNGMMELQSLVHMELLYLIIIIILLVNYMEENHLVKNLWTIIMENYLIHGI